MNRYELEDPPTEAQQAAVSTAITIWRTLFFFLNHDEMVFGLVPPTYGQPR
jgi:hypothetical protein